tara:strand:+ start:35 stop:409 length:375 start_codon:yes stop_codon:yes gene_type:complete
MELYGMGGSMIMPDPNFFSGDIMLSKENSEWNKITNDEMLLGIPNKTENNGSKIANYRGIGLSDLIDAIIKNRKPRCSLDLSLHVLEAMEGIIKSAESNKIINLITKPNKPDFLDEKEILTLKR